MSANDTQVGGDHYRVEDGPQHWDLMKHYGPGYYIGNATKYLTRWRKKNGVEDLKKSRHYVVKLDELAKAGQVFPWPVPKFTDMDFITFVKKNELTPEEAKACRYLFFWAGMSDLQVVLKIIDKLLTEAEGGAELPTA
jgi:hypothetical protein